MLRRANRQSLAGSRRSSQVNGRMQNLVASIVTVALAEAQRRCPENFEFGMLIGNGCLASANGRKPRPAVPAVRTERGIPEARCQPWPDFLPTQIEGHRADQVVANLGVNLVKRVVIQRGKIISVRKFR